MSYSIKEVFPQKDMAAWIDIVRLHSITLSEDVTKVPDEGCWFLVYDEGSKPVAFAGLTEYGVTKIKGRNKKVGMLVRCGVIEDARGNGLQRKLIEARITKALKLKYKVLYSSTLENPESSNNLIECGFRMFLPDDEWGIEGTCYWRKYL